MDENPVEEKIKELTQEEINKALYKEVAVLYQFTLKALQDLKQIKEVQQISHSQRVIVAQRLTAIETALKEKNITVTPIRFN